MAKSRFVWHDFVAADVDGAKRFYGELFGWTWKPGEHDYTHIEAGGKPIGGIMLKPKEAANMPAHWLGYVGVDDCAAATQKLTQLGGRVYHQESLEKVGKFAICSDPMGAMFAPFQPARGVEGAEATGKPAMYTFCWDELLTPEPEAAVKFYTSLFGWGTEHMDMPGFGRYHLLKRTGVDDGMGGVKNAGGVMKMPPGVPHPFWLTYVAVPNADDTVAKAKKLGATMTSPPMDIPNVGRFATMLDAQHAPFAILAPSM